MSIKQGFLFVYQICQAPLNVLNPPISDGAICIIKHSIINEIREFWDVKKKCEGRRAKVQFLFVTCICRVI